MKRHEDHRYIEALRKGDNLLLEELYENYSKTVTRWIMNNSGNMADARDIFQEAIIAMYNKACDPTYVLSCPIGGLLVQICKNKWIDQIRKKSKDTEVRNIEKERYTNEQETASQLEIIEEEEIRQSKLEKAFAQLSDLCQKLLKLYAEGLKAEAIRVKMEMENVNTLYRRKNACTERWKVVYEG